MADTGYSTFPVTDTGVFHGKLLGVITDKDFDVRYDRTCQVAERMRTDVQVGVAIDDLKVAERVVSEAAEAGGASGPGIEGGSETEVY